VNRRAKKPNRVHSKQSSGHQAQTSPSYLVSLSSKSSNGSTRWPTKTLSSFDHFAKTKFVLPPPAMGFPGLLPHKAGNNIVEEYLSPNDAYYVEDFSTFKRLTDAEKIEVIAREAEEHGLEKPLGWNVSFHYNPHVEYHHFGSSHPMKPWRLTLTKQLVLSYGLEYTMDLYTPRPANFGELALFHDREYLSYLSK
jgi:hypothetical protein